jgi:biopolymer transport protein ExbD
VNAEQVPTPPNRRSWAIDCLLMVLAILCAAAVCWRVPRAGTLYRPCQLTAGDQASASDVTIYVDDINRIHVGSKLLSSDAELASHLTTAPGRVLLLVHPDGLFENVMRTVEVLRQAGAESIQLGTTRQSA